MVLKEKIAIAGATGNLGERIVNQLINNKAFVIAILRKETDGEKIKKIKSLGAEIIITDFKNLEALVQSLKGIWCLISALSGLHEVILERQSFLLNAAISAQIPRFIPSDFSIDFTGIPEGKNRNLDLRKKFHLILNNSKISSTSIFNGAFSEMLKGQMPLILYKIKKVLYFQNPDQKMDFTSIDNVAEFTSKVALEKETPRYMRISGDEKSAREIAEIATEVSGEKFGLLYGGSLKFLDLLIKILKTIMPQKRKLYPIWQGMQYFRNMFDGSGKLENLENERYPEIKWKKVKDILEEKFKKIDL